MSDYGLDLERSVLGICLLEPAALITAERILVPEDFADRRHARLFEVMIEMRRAGAYISPVSVGLELKRRGFLDDDGEEYLTTLISNPVAADPRAIEERARLLRDESLRRIAERHLMSAAAEVRHRRTSLVEILASLRTKISELEVLSDRQELPPIAVVADELLTQLERGTMEVGTPTGLTPLDEVIAGGIKPGQMVVLAGATGSGKTSLAMEIALLSAQWAAKDPIGRGWVLVFSFEMSANELVVRLVQQVVPIVDGYRPPHGFSNRDKPKVREAIKRIRDLPIRIETDAPRTVAGVRGAVERFILEHGRPSLVIIDHIGLMKDPAVRGGRTEEVSAITAALKTMAMQLKIPLLALAQLNREVGRREDHRPQLTDLRESGSIEQDSNIVLLVYRPSYYWKDEELKRAEEEKGAEAFVIIAKNRSGPTASLKFEWIGPRYLFRIPADWLTKHNISDNYGLIEHPAAVLNQQSNLDEKSPSIEDDAARSTTAEHRRTPDRDEEDDLDSLFG